MTELCIQTKITLLSNLKLTRFVFTTVCLMCASTISMESPVTSPNRTVPCTACKICERCAGTGKKLIRGIELFCGDCGGKARTTAEGKRIRNSTGKCLACKGKDYVEMPTIPKPPQPVTKFIGYDTDESESDENSSKDVVPPLRIALPSAFGDHASTDSEPSLENQREQPKKPLTERLRRMEDPYVAFLPNDINKLILELAWYKEEANRIYDEKDPQLMDFISGLKCNFISKPESPIQESPGRSSSHWHSYC